MYRFLLSLSYTKNITQAGTPGSELRTLLFRPNVFKMNSINTDKIIHAQI